MKKFVLFVLTFVLLAVMVAPVAAAPEAPVKSGIFSAIGKITALGENTVTIKVVAGNYLVKPYKGQTLTITVTPTTRYLYKVGTLVTPSTFADLAVGDPVSIRGRLKLDGVWYALRVTEGANLKCLLP